MESKRPLSEEEAQWRDLLANYERTPTPRAERLFKARLDQQSQRTSRKFWMWGLAAGLALVGTWWFGMPSDEVLSPMALTQPEKVLKIAATQPTPVLEVSSQPVKEIDKNREGMAVHEKDQASGASSNLGSAELRAKVEDEVPNRLLAMETKPLEVMTPREISVMADRWVEVAYQVPVGQLSGAESSRRTMGYWLDELLILKYGEPVEERPILSALLTGDESTLLETERAELKERFTWIKEKLTR